MRSRILTPLALLAALSACSVSPRTAPQGAYDIKATFVTAEKAVNAYRNLPQCSATQQQPCSEPVIAEAMVKQADKARPLVNAAEAAARDTSHGQPDAEKANIVAQQAVIALQKLTYTAKE